MGKIIICGVGTVEREVRENPGAAVLSIEHPWDPKDPNPLYNKPDAPRLEGVIQKILCFADVEFRIEKEAHKAPNMPATIEGINFILEHIHDRDVIVHCHRGKARSCSIALGAMALMHTDKDEKTLAEELLKIRPIAAPNPIVLEDADHHAGRGGRLLQAVLDHPVLKNQINAARASRQRMMREDPDLARRIFPEQFVNPPKPPQ
jgi:hypothetical protein